MIGNARVNNGRVLLPTGAAYHLLVLPSFDTMTPALVRKLKELVESGATVVGNPPIKSPSLSDFPFCDREVLSLAFALWGGTSPPYRISVRKVGQGRVFWGVSLYPTTAIENSLYPAYETTEQILIGSGLPPDFESDGPIRFTHRRRDETEIYFVSNRSAELVEADCYFRVAGRKPELWDPLTGSTRRLPAYSEHEGRTLVHLRFEAQQSFFVVFQTESKPAPGSFVNFPNGSVIEEMTGPWEVTFKPHSSNLKRVRLKTLADWRTHSDPDLKYYSGIATYLRRFDLPDAVHPETTALLLDIGVVHSIARVRLNGTDLGVLWCAPWRVDITSVLKATDNQLEIEVANLWPNRLIRDASLEPSQQVTWTTWNPYKPDSPLLPSGLLGPVSIVTSE
jgi:hypothetical protein